MNATEMVIQKVKALPDDLVQDLLAYLERLERQAAEEDRLDLEAARMSLAETGECITIDELERRLGL